MYVILDNNKNEKNASNGKKSGFGRFFKRSKSKNKFNSFSNFNKIKGSGSKGKYFVYFLVFILIITISFLSGFFGSLFNDYLKKRNGPADSGSSVDVKEPDVGSGEIIDVESLVERVIPSIVGVLAPNGSERRGSVFGKFPFSSLFPFISDDNDDGFCNLKSSIERPKLDNITLGSGFFVKHENSCYVLTNYHIIKRYVKNVIASGKASDKHVSVILKNDLDHQKRAEIVGYDVDCDLAVLKVPELVDSKIACLKFADPKKIKIGAMAIALGNPITPDYYTVTRGIVSGRRKLKTDSFSGDFSLPVIQTDAAINPGNSGGPLINSHGEVIGMNTSKLKSGVSDAVIEGMAFSTDVEIIEPKFLEIVKTGSKNEGSKMPTLGVSFSPSADYEGKNCTGLFIRSFTNNSPGEKAGLRLNDLIISIDGTGVVRLSDLRKVLSRKNIGDVVRVQVLRGGGKDVTVNVRLGADSHDDESAKLI